jgi:hypothetical protein
VIASGLIDQDSGDVSRLTDRSDTHEQRHILIVEIPTFANFVNRAGFASHGEAWNLSKSCGTARLSHSTEHRQHVPGNIGCDNLFTLKRSLLILLD